MWANFRKSPDRELAISRYESLAESYDQSCRFIGTARATALEALQLSPGEIVFDVACGTGSMLCALAAKVGADGRVIGIEQSPAMARLARARLASAGLGQERASVIEASVERAPLASTADALLFCYTHDVLQSHEALENLIRHSRPGARIVVVGNRFQPWWWAAPINLWVCVRGWRYHTTYEGFREPWRPLLVHCPELRVVRTFHLGMSYLATGHVVRAE